MCFIRGGLCESLRAKQHTEQCLQRQYFVISALLGLEKKKAGTNAGPSDS